MRDTRFETVRERECRRKRRYASEGEAKEMARLQMLEGSGPLKAYSCIWCRGWHLAKDKA